MKNTKSDLASMFETIHAGFSLGHHGQDGTIFKLKQPLDQEKNEDEIGRLLTFLHGLPQVKRKNKQMKKQGQILGLYFARPASGYPAVIGFHFRDDNEFAG